MPFANDRQYVLTAIIELSSNKLEPLKLAAEQSADKLNLLNYIERCEHYTVEVQRRFETVKMKPRPRAYWHPSTCGPLGPAPQEMSDGDKAFP